MTVRVITFVKGVPTMRTKTAILSILATSLMSYAAVAQEEAPPPAEGAAPAAEGAPAAAPEAAPAPAPEAEAPVAAAPAAATPSGYSDQYALRPLTLSAMMFQGTLPVVLNLSKSAMLKPVWIPLDLRFGVTNEFEVFVSHSDMGLPLAFGYGGLCLGGTSRGCEKAYNNVNVGGQYSFFKNAGVELSGLLALEFRRISDPMLLAADVGVGFKYVAAPVSVRLSPQIGIGLNKRSGSSSTVNLGGGSTTNTLPGGGTVTTTTSSTETTTVSGNKEVISIPLQIAFQAAPQIAVFLDSGLFGPTSHFGDEYLVPIGIGASFLAMHGLDVGAEFMLDAVAKGSAIGGGAADMRTLMLFASWRSQ
jgi:hypothetical protein